MHRPTAGFWEEAFLMREVPLYTSNKQDAGRIPQDPQPNKPVSNRTRINWDPQPNKPAKRT